jgi:hypothetical protein
MASKEYAFKYGRGELRFRLDPTQVKGELRIKDFPPLPDPEPPFSKPSAIRSGPSLSEMVNQTVCFIVNDPTRVANSQVLPILLS